MRTFVFSPPFYLNIFFILQKCTSLTYDVCRSPSLGSRSHSDGEGGVNPHDVDRYYDGNSHHNPAVDNDIIGQVPEIYIPNPEYLTRFPASELRYSATHYLNTTSY